ncbi:hypothetical protein MRX96_020860 [Rhipicephalus microplus]
MPGQSIDQFMTALHILAEKCDFGEFKQRLTRDHFVVGLWGKKLPESLKMDPKQSLAKALAKARLKKTVQQQQAELRNSNDVRDSTQFNPCEEANVDAVGHRTKPRRSLPGVVNLMDDILIFGDSKGNMILGYRMS